jgi:hypothetical protein
VPALYVEEKSRRAQYHTQCSCVEKSAHPAAVSQQDGLLNKEKGMACCEAGKRTEKAAASRGG